MVEEMGVEDGEDKQMKQIQNFLVHFLEAVLEVVTVEEKEDKHQEKINQVPGSLGWKLFLVEGTTTAVIVVEMDTTMDLTMDLTMETIMDLTMDLTMETTMDLTMDLTMETTMDLAMETAIVLTMETTMALSMETTMDLVMETTMDSAVEITTNLDLIMETAMSEEGSTLEEALEDANVIITSHSKIDMEELMEPVRELMRQARYGATLPDMDVVMLGIHRDFLITLGLTKLVVVRVESYYSYYNGSLSQ